MRATLLITALLLGACQAEHRSSDLYRSRVPSPAVDNLYRVTPTTSNVPMVNTFVVFEKRGRCLVARSSTIDFTPVFVTTMPVAVERRGIRMGHNLLEFGHRYEFIGATGGTQENDNVGTSGCPKRTMSIPGMPQSPD